MTQFIGTPIEAKMASFLPEKPRDENKNETKLINLSLKDVDTEIDKFVQANTRELAKDKWLCPLSGKKFKGWYTFQTRLCLYYRIMIFNRS